MIDPRAQGAGGIARKLQSLLGIPDRHCVDVDAWRGMSVRELLRHHLSPERVASTADEYHCLPPRR